MNILIFAYVSSKQTLHELVTVVSALLADFAYLCQTQHFFETLPEIVLLDGG